MKLVCQESESDELIQWLATVTAPIATYDLTRTELLRVVRRRKPESLVYAREILQCLTVLKLPTSVFDSACRIDPAEVRSLDAIHLSAACELGDELEAFVADDKPLLSAAARCGMKTLSPGA